MMKFLTFGFPVLLVIAMFVAWFFLVRPWLMRYQATAGILQRLEEDELKGISWLWLKLKGLWTLILLWVTSLLTGCWGLVEAAFGVDPSALAPFQNSSIWHGILQDEMALRAASIATLVAAVIALKGKVHDIATPPKSGA